MATTPLEKTELRGRNGNKMADDAAIIEESGSLDSGRNKDSVVMARMGKKQQLNRSFGFIPVLALSSTVLSSWESICATFAAGLVNGGSVALVYGFILAAIGTMCLAASLAEMASITPISGAQYHWTAQFAPKRAAAFVSWMQGWITVFAWQAALTSVAFLAATQMQGLFVLQYPDYIYKRWHATLLMWALTAITFVINVFGIRILPHLETLAGACHVLFFFALLIPLVCLAPTTSSAKFVFTDFQNQGGWSSDGMSWCLGLLTATFSLVGFDGAVHMSEEVSNAPLTIPRVMVLTILFNGLLAFGFLLAILFSIGDVERALNTPTGYPIIEIFYQATGSTHATTVMMGAIIVIDFTSAFGILAATSRLTWAFARDRGLPFSDFFAYVNPHYKIPIRAIALVATFVLLLSLINIASTTAFNAILSLTTLALYCSYLIPISLLVLKRLKNEPIPFGPWRLGRFGMAINVMALVYGVFICIFLPFPPFQPVTAKNMNYGGPVIAVVLASAVGDWFFRGKGRFVGPIREVGVREEESF